MTKRKKAKAATKAKAKGASTPKSKRPDGSISSGIYDAVEKLVADGKMKRSAAFRQIAKETGRKEGTVAVNYYYVARKRRPATKKAAAKSATTRAAKASKAAAKPGTRSKGIAATIYDAIEKLVAGDKMTRAAAFRQHAKATGRKEGTVAVNYYYAAKKRKATKRGPGRPKAAVATSRNGAGSSRIAFVLKSLADLIRSQESQLASLRRDNERFAALRKLLAS